MKFFQIISVLISASDELVNFREKIQTRAKQLTGIDFSADAHNDTSVLVNVSISFNNENGLTVNQAVKVPEIPLTKSFPLSFMQPLIANSNVTGCVEDLGVASAYPYTLKIYLHLEED